MFQVLFNSTVCVHCILTNVISRINIILFLQCYWINSNLYIYISTFSIEILPCQFVNIYSKSVVLSLRLDGLEQCVCCVVHGGWMLNVRFIWSGYVIQEKLMIKSNILVFCLLIFRATCHRNGCVCDLQLFRYEQHWWWFMLSEGCYCLYLGV